MCAPRHKANIVTPKDALRVYILCRLWASSWKQINLCETPSAVLLFFQVLLTLKNVHLSRSLLCFGVFPCDWYNVPNPGCKKSVYVHLCLKITYPAGSTRPCVNISTNIHFLKSADTTTYQAAAGWIRPPCSLWCFKKHMTVKRHLNPKRFLW